MDARVTQWSSLIEVGIPDIDAQHRQLFELAATFAGQGDGIRIMKSLAILCDYAKVHLHDEELLLTTIGYPDIEAHREAHVVFRQMLRTLLQEAGKLTLDEIANRVDRLINGWFYNHVMHVDVLYVPMVVAYKAYQERLQAARHEADSLPPPYPDVFTKE